MALKKKVETRGEFLSKFKPRTQQLMTAARARAFRNPKTPRSGQRRKEIAKTLKKFKKTKDKDLRMARLTSGF